MRKNINALPRMKRNIAHTLYLPLLDSSAPLQQIWLTHVAPLCRSRSNAMLSLHLNLIALSVYRKHQLPLRSQQEVEH